MTRRTRKPKGWTKHPYEHAMAAKGISSRDHGLLPMRDSGHVWSFAVEEDGGISLSLGNLSDAGWYWTGDETDFVGFIARIHTDPEARRQWNEFLAENNLSFEDMKPYLLAAVEDETSFYVLSGDNARWRIGEELDMHPEEIFGYLYGDEVWDAFDGDQQKRLENEFDREYSGVGFDEFYKERESEFESDLKSGIERAKSWEDVLESFRDLHSDNNEQYLLAQSCAADEAMEKAYKSLQTRGRAKLKSSGKKRLSVPERHQLRIAKDTLKMPDAMAAVMGGPSKAEARKTIKRLEG